MENKDVKSVDLIKRLQQGEEEAFNELYQQYAKLVYFIANKICQNDADSKDIVQETFIEVRRSIGTLQNPNVFKFWLNRITLSKCKNLFRKNKYVLVDEDTIYAQLMPIEERDYFVPDKNMRKLSDKEVLASLIDRLPTGQQQVLILFYLEQFSIEEVAKIMDLPEGTVKSRLSYARNFLKTAIGKYEETNDIKLSFHSLGEGITACFIAQCASISIPTLITGVDLGSVAQSTVSSGFKTFLTTGVAKVGIASIVLVSAGGTAYAINEINEKRFQEQNAIKNIVKDEEEEQKFPTLVVKGKEINTSKSAYFNLKLWACCEEEMKQLSKEELHDIQTVYTTLKQIHSPYYEALQKDGWAKSLEEQLKSNRNEN